MFNNDEVIKEELQLIVDDIRQLYEDSGKKVTGQYGEGFVVNVLDGKGSIEGYIYTGGRPAGKMPPIDKIKQWVLDKGIAANVSRVSSVAYLIAKSIKEKGTNPDYHRQFVDEVITPERIQKILDNISQINMQMFVTEVSVELNKLVKNV